VDLSNIPPYAFVALFPVLWFAICELLAFVGGWRRLAEHYPHSGPAPAETARFRSGRVGWVNYNNCLIVGAAPTGLYLSVLLPFRPGHAPLLIPWNDVRAEPEGGWLKRVRLQFSRAPSVGFRLSGEHPEIIRLACGR
jgi:hypothetical protein